MRIPGGNPGGIFGKMLGELPGGIAGGVRKEFLEKYQKILEEFL